MTEDSREPCTSVTRAVCSWLCRAAVNKAHEHRNEASVSLSLLLALITHRGSCLEESELSAECPGTEQAALELCQAGLCGIWDRCHSPLSPGPSWFSSWEVFPREICAEHSFQTGLAGAACREHPLGWPQGEFLPSACP